MSWNAISTDGDFFSKIDLFDMVARYPPVPYDKFEKALKRRIDGVTTDDGARKELEETPGVYRRCLPEYLLRSLLKSFVSIDDFRRDANVVGALIRSYLDRPETESDCVMNALTTKSRASPAVREAFCDIVGVCVNVGFVSTEELFRWWSSMHNDASVVEKNAVEMYLEDGSLMDLWNLSDELARARFEPAMLRLRWRTGTGVGRLIKHT